MVTYRHYLHLLVSMQIINIFLSLLTYACFFFFFRVLFFIFFLNILIFVSLYFYLYFLWSENNVWLSLSPRPPPWPITEYSIQDRIQLQRPNFLNKLCLVSQAYNYTTELAINTVCVCLPVCAFRSISSSFLSCLAHVQAKVTGTKLTSLSVYNEELYIFKLD